MSQISIEAAKQQLGQIAKSYQRPLRGKFAVLAPLREEIMELNRRGAASAEIASILAQYQVTVSKDTVGRFLREEAKKERTNRAKKPGSETQASGNESAPPTKPTVPRMTPRLAPPANQ